MPRHTAGVPVDVTILRAMLRDPEFVASYNQACDDAIRKVCAYLVPAIGFKNARDIAETVTGQKWAEVWPG